MDFDLRKRKKWPNDAGVSDVIGNILILMITVVLFSGIIAFVQQIPVPQQTTKADFSASISFSNDYKTANLTLVHAGGKVLESKEVSILIEKDGTIYQHSLSNDSHFQGTTWSTGKPWTIQINDTTVSSVIVVTVIDIKNSMMIWTSQVTGGLAGSPPSIEQRYVDSEPATPTPDPVKEGDWFSLYVKVEDSDSDLSRVWIDASAVKIPGYNNNNWDGTPTSVGWYNWNFGQIKNGTVQEVDGNVIVIHALDSAGHESISNFVLDVTILPSDTKIEQMPTYTDLGTSGLPAYLSFISGALGHGFGFYRELLDDEGARRGKADTTLPSVYFTKDENVFIRFGSLTMSNVYTDNRLVITDTRTGLTFTPDYADATPNSTSTAPFYPYPTGGGAYVFECAFSTKNLPQSTYTISMYLKNLPGLGQTQQSFAADQLISVNQTGSPASFMPEIRLYKDSNLSTMWGYARDLMFDISNSASNTVYVVIQVQNTIAGTASVAEVRITDLSGGSEMFGTPPAGGMISSIGVSGDNYTFSLSLRLNNGDMWLPGTNAYTVYVSKLNDTNEGVYSLSKQLWVKGSQGKADFFAGTAGMASGNSNFNTREYQYFIQNNNFFSDRVMWQSESTPGSSTDFTVTALGVGDIDDDGDKDLLMGQASSNLLLLFENTLNSFGSWQSAASISRPDGITYPITSIAFGDFSGDGHPDFAYSNSNSQVVLYNVTYGSRGWIFRPLANVTWSGTIAKIDLKDMSGDGRADLVMLAGGKIYVYDLKYGYDVVLKQYQWKVLYAKSSTGVGVKDFDVDDVNRDGYYDILTTGTSSAFGSNAGVNANLYGVAGSSYKLIDEGATGYLPRMLYGTHNGTVGNTKAQGGSPVQYISFEETISGNNSQVAGIMRFDRLSPSVADQVLRIVAKVSPGPGTSESFYVWVSTDDSTYGYVGEITATDYTTYNFKLPATVVGTQMYIKFTDSLSSLDSVQDIIYVDYCAVVTTTPGYTESIVKATDSTWTSVRAAEINDPQGTGSWMEVVMAKDGTGGIKIFRYTTGWVDSVWEPSASAASSATFVDDCAGKVNDASKYPFSTLAPTLFDAVDINGDGFTDLLVCNYTEDGSLLVSNIGFYMNLYSGGPVWRYYLVKHWAMDPPTGQAKNPYISVVVAASLAAT